MKNITYCHTDLALELQEELDQEELNQDNRSQKAMNPGEQTQKVSHQNKRNLNQRIPNQDNSQTKPSNINHPKTHPGYSVRQRTRKNGRISEVIVTIENEQGERLFRKPKGTYLSLESADLSKNDGDYHEDMSSLLAEHLEHFMEGRKKILFAGLGNAEVTPDALGPLVIHNLLITNHLRTLPFFEKMRSSMAIAPGVMAQTGMETSELLKAIIDKCEPDLLLVIDALAAKTSERLNRTVQICDTGILPGAGVGNHRKEISEHTMGVPVLAIGVPTVISLPSIAREIVDSFRTSMGYNDPQSTYELWSERKQYDFMAKNIREDFFSLTVTPKDIDAAVKRISYTISEGINRIIAKKTV
ncbi:MAG: GPR endopeptidase [Clostridiales bacterium]|nr:GPR endopeptidase [Clostridiales bacterium]